MDSRISFLPLINPHPPTLGCVSRSRLTKTVAIIVIAAVEAVVANAMLKSVQEKDSSSSFRAHWLRDYGTRVGENGCIALLVLGIWGVMVAIFSLCTNFSRVSLSRFERCRSEEEVKKYFFSSIDHGGEEDMWRADCLQEHEAVLLLPTDQDIIDEDVVRIVMLYRLTSRYEKQRVVIEVTKNNREIEFWMDVKNKVINKLNNFYNVRITHFLVPGGMWPR